MIKWSEAKIDKKDLLGQARDYIEKIKIEKELQKPDKEEDTKDKEKKQEKSEENKQEEKKQPEQPQKKNKTPGPTNF